MGGGGFEGGLGVGQWFLETLTADMEPIERLMLADDLALLEGWLAKRRQDDRDARGD